MDEREEIYPYTKKLHDAGIKYIYGNGIQAAVVCGIMIDACINFNGVVLPPGSERKILLGYWERIMKKVNILSFSEFLNIVDNDSVILMACDRKEYDIVQRILNDAGYFHVIGCDWTHNSDLIEANYDAWITE